MNSLNKILSILAFMGVLGFSQGQGNLPSKEIVDAKIAKSTQLNSGWRPLDFTRAITGPEQDCASAIPLCATTYTETESYTGYGSTQEVSTSTCLSSGETNSVWYMFTVTTAGTFAFSINTLNDYDWALYDITTIGCEGVPTATPDRCNFSGTYGTTGLTLPVSATIPLSEGAGGSPTMAGLNVSVGSTYALIIDNWSGDDNGYTITFSGTSSIFDATDPVMSAVASCYSNDIFITMDEDVLCSSILQADFILTNTTTTTNFSSAITGISGVGCSGLYTDEIEISHDGTLTTGSYELEINTGPSLQDACGNIIDAGTTITFDYLAPISLGASSSTICNSGDPVTLTTTGGPSGQTYTLQPGGATNTTGVFSVNPTSTTTYSVEVTYGGCTKTANTTVIVEDNIVVSVTPIDPQVCSGSATLTASTTIDGVACGSCTYVWSTTETTSSISAANGSTYTVNATTPAGCASDNTGSSTVTLASASGSSTCDVLYVSPSGGGDGTTKGAPTTLSAALTAALCSSTIIKMQGGNYNFTDRIEVNSYVTIEGGYNTGFTTKSSSMASGTATTLIRSTATDGDDATSCTMFDIAASADDWRIENLRIEMPDNSSSTGVTNYGLYIPSGCTGYEVVRCYIDAGTGSDGGAGSPVTYSSGTVGSPQADVTKNLCEGSDDIVIPAQGCNVDPADIEVNVDLECTDCQCFSIRLVTPDFGSGTDELSLIWGNSDPSWNNPDVTFMDAGTYTSWTSGGSSNTSSFQPQGDGNTWCSSTPNVSSFGAINGGTSMNMGGTWSLFVERGNCASGTTTFTDWSITFPGCPTGSGDSYGIYAESSTGSSITDCEITGTASTGGITGKVYHPTDASYTSVAISGYDVINAENVSCRDVDIDFTKPASSGDWSNLGTNSTPGTSTSDNVTVQYSGGSLERKSVTIGSSCAVENPTTSPGSAITNGCGSVVTSTLNVTGGCAVNTTNITCNVDISHTYNSDLEIYLQAPNGDILELCTDNGGNKNDIDITFSDAAGSSVTTISGNNVVGTYSPESTTNAGSCYTGTVTGGFAGIGGGSYDPAGTWTLIVVDDAGGDNGTLTDWTLNIPSASGSTTYTEFVNMKMDAPSTGSVLGSSEVCPGTFSFASSEAGTPGFVYAWSCVDPAGGTSSFDAASSSSTNCTFTNSTASAIVFPVQLTITSECCGQLTPITFNVTVNPSPAAPTATNATPTNCEGGEDTLSVTAVTNTSYSWFNASTGGTLLGTGDEYIVSSTANGTTSYYVEAVSDKGCVSTTRTQIDLSSTNPAPTTSGASNCAPGLITVSVTSPVSGATYYWYDASSGGSLLQSGNATTYDVTVASATTVSTWVSVVTETGCDESARTQVDATVTAAPTSTTWTGSTDSDWFKSTNWSDCVPTCEVNAIIPTSTPDCDIDFDNGGIAYAKSLTINSGGTLKLVDPKTIVELCGDYVQNGTLTAAGQGKIVMASTTGAQNWTKGSTGSGNLYKLEINNSNGVNVTNNSGDKSVQFRTDGELILTSGVLTVPSSLRVNMKNTDTTSITGHSASSYVNGEIRRFVSDANSANSYDFPVGNATSYQLMTINVNQSTMTSGMTRIDVSFADGAVGTGLTIIDANTLFYDGVLDNGGGTAGIWTAEPNTGESCTYDVTLNGRVFTNSALNHTVLKRDNSSSAWGWAGSTVGSQSVSGSLVQTNRTGYTSFSEFAIARTNTALPVEFMSFTATLNDDVVELAWETAQEMNSDYFTVMRSPDGVNWEDIVEVDAAGVSNQIVRYFELDVEPLIGKSYYKIRQTDINGEASLSNIAPIVNNPSSMNDVLVYPNPSNGNNFILGIEGFDGEDLLIVLRDINGRELYSKVTMSADHNGVIDIVLDRTLPPGNYLIIAASDHSMVSKKFQVRK